MISTEDVCPSAHHLPGHPKSLPARKTFRKSRKIVPSSSLNRDPTTVRRIRSVRRRGRGGRIRLRRFRGKQQQAVFRVATDRSVETDFVSKQQRQTTIRVELEKVLQLSKGFGKVKKNHLFVILEIMLNHRKIVC
jgi:hypothetical protein